MKHFFAAALLLAALAAPAAAQVHGTWGDAHVVPVNGRLGGAYLQFDRHSATVQGQLRLSFYPNLDFGFNGGLSRIDFGSNTRTSVRLGGDFRGQIAAESESFPITVALGGAIGMESADDFTILAVGPQLQISRALSGKWVAYTGAALLLSRYDIGPRSDTDTSFPVRAGLEFRPNTDLRVVLEGQLSISDDIRDDASFSFGVNLPF